MFKFSKTPLGRFRLIAIIEGISYLVLLFIAMPLKYWGGVPDAVKYTGWAHGILFMLFIVALLHVWINNKWSFIKATLAFISSLIPFGTFLLDKSLIKEEKTMITAAEVK